MRHTKRPPLRPGAAAVLPGVRRARPATLVLTMLLAPLLGGCDTETPPRVGAPASRSSVASGGRFPATPRAREGPPIVFLGDSIAAGFGVASDESFPAVLARQLADGGAPFRLVNAGVSGDTTAGGLARLDWLLKQKPRILVVELGGNDALRGQPLEGIERNLRRIVSRARDAGCRVLLLGMRVPPSYGPEYAEGFASIYDRLGELEGVELVPFFMEDVGGVPELNLPDGIHPTAKGHSLLAETVRPALERLLAELEE